MRETWAGDSVYGDLQAAIRANNRVWYLLYYDELVERPECQLTLLRGADWNYYNCAQAICRVTPKLLDEVEAFYAREGLAPGVYLDPAAPGELLPLLIERGYEELPAELELWHVLELGTLPQMVSLQEVLKVPLSALRRVEVTQRSGALFDTFVGLDARENGLSTAVAEKLARNLADRRLPGVEFHCLLYLLEDVPVATGAVGIVGELALFAEAATASSHRRLGLHSAMLLERVALARAAGCRWAYFTSTEHASSALSGARVGFRRVFERRFFQRR
ncbi:MAG: hypothetical protein IT371_00875 [Deltaproteobacteria bacterium]|nr:hypothetical protein [Deltaproteobacteria bacterium]